MTASQIKSTLRPKGKKLGVRAMGAEAKLSFSMKLWTLSLFPCAMSTATVFDLGYGRMRSKFKKTQPATPSNLRVRGEYHIKDTNFFRFHKCPNSHFTCFRSLKPTVGTGVPWKKMSKCTGVWQQTSYSIPVGWARRLLLRKRETEAWWHPLHGRHATPHHDTSPGNHTSSYPPYPLLHSFLSETVNHLFQITCVYPPRIESSRQHPTPHQELVVVKSNSSTLPPLFHIHVSTRNL